MMTRTGDEAFAKPSALPDWTRAHVLPPGAARGERRAAHLGGRRGRRGGGGPWPGRGARGMAARPLEGPRPPYRAGHAPLGPPGLDLMADSPDFAAVRAEFALPADFP